MLFPMATSAGVESFLVVITYWIGTRQYGLCRRNYIIEPLLMKSICRITHSSKESRLYSLSSIMQGHSHRCRRLIRLETRRQSPPATPDWLEANGWKNAVTINNEELLLQYLLYKAATHHSRQQLSLCPYRTCCRSPENAQQATSTLWCNPHSNPK